MPPTYPPTDRLASPVRKKRPVLGIFLLGLIIGAAGFFLLIGPPRAIDDLAELFVPPVRPYAAYVDALEKSHVDESAMGKAWLEAGEDAWAHPVQIVPPHLESGYISPLEQPVISYQIKPRRGQKLTIQIELTSVVDSPQVFIELFEKVPGKQQPDLVAFADSGSYQLQYQVEEDESYILRIQPELLARFSYRLQVVLGASLAFPVAGKDSRAIKSFWGAPRDGGRRKHKGVDIFARKGTPVLAAADGRIRSVKNGGLGGKVVWQRDVSERYNLYYAHLDTQMVRRGQLVKVGDTLGLVGNTGNARTTPPHLHFGIYQRRRGAVDPFPFIDVPDSTLPRLVAADSGMHRWYRINRKTKLLYTPTRKADPLKELRIGMPVRRLAASGRWHRIQLPDGTQGFVSHTHTSPDISALERLQLNQEQDVYDQVRGGVIIDRLEVGSEIEVLAQTETHQYIRTETGKLGYVSRRQL